MKIGILNAGNIGRSLAVPWLRAGHDLLLATQGSPEKLDAFLRQFPSARGGRTNEAARFCEVVLFSVYWPRFEASLAAVDELTDKIVIDTISPLKCQRAVRAHPQSGVHGKFIHLRGVAEASASGARLQSI